MGALLVTALIGLVALASVGGYAVITDQVPVKVGGYTNLDIIPPCGEHREISKEQMVSYCPEISDIMRDIPHIDDVEYAVFETSLERDEIIDCYIDTLSNQGYEYKYEGYTFIGGHAVYYYGFLKTATAVGLLVCDDINGHQTIVGYITGFAMYLEDMIDWYKSGVN